MVMKKCPFCAEDIKDEAVKCKHCGSMLSVAAPLASGHVPATTAPSKAKGKRNITKELIVLGVISAVIGGVMWSAYKDSKGSGAASSKSSDADFAHRDRRNRR